MPALLGSSEMHARVRAHDWAKSPLGPIEAWPESLRALTRTLLASRYPMVLTWGPDLTQIYNDAYAELIGDKHPGALGEDIRITLAEAWSTLGPMIEDVMQRGVANWTPALMLRLDRSGYAEEAYFSVSHAPAEDDEGSIVGMLAVCSEVTHQVLGERRLRLLRELASRAGDTRRVEQTCTELADAIACHPLDVPFALVYLRDPSGEKLVRRASVGLPEEAPAGPAEVAAEAHHASPFPLSRAASGQAAVVEGDDLARLLALSGGAFGEPVRRAIVLPIASAGGAPPLGALVLGLSPSRALDEGYRSFCELLAGQVSVALRNALAYEDERQKAETLAELDRAKTAFFNNVSHELRTPLTLILGPIDDLLADGAEPLAPAQRERAELVRRSAVRLLKLVNTLLEFTRVEAGRARATFEPLDLAELTRSMASLFESAVRRAGLAFELDVPDLGEPVFVDRDAFEKIVSNLLSNALKFTLEGKIEVALRRAPAGARGEVARLEVRDSGTGISEADLPHVFERFRRIEGARARSHEGSGIGLALVRELAEMHRGRALAESEPGRGSTFIVEIPLGSSHLAPERIAPPSRPARPASEAAAPFVAEALRWLPEEPPARLLGPPKAGAPGAGDALSRVLVVDDNPDLRSYVAGLLAPLYEIEVARDGLEALSAARERRPDLVLCDVMMPNMDGFELVRAIRADPETRGVPVVLLSARAGDEPVSEGLEAGADDYLVKPFSSRELLARVRTHISLARTRAELARERAELLAERELARERAELLERAREARRITEEVSRLKDEFLATVSHELRTPLTAILGWATLLQRTGGGPEALAKGIEVITRNARVQLRIVEELLDLSRISRGDMELDLRTFDAAEVVRDALDALSPSADARQITVTSSGLDERLPFFGDPARLRQIATNLVGNAIKFNVPGGSVRVACSLERGCGAPRLGLRVADEGLGIAPEFLPHVFDRFRQANGSASREHGGLGLGLAIVKSLVELHGGEIRAESDGPGRGATFSVLLPSPRPPTERTPAAPRAPGVRARRSRRLGR